MIKDQDIVELIELLEVRQTSLYHACQFADFQAYLRLGGIPSRAYLEQNQECFTPFETDGIDQVNEVWDKVFVNLSDFGDRFARLSMGVPNPFGPIVLQIRPSTLLKANDVAVSLRSAGCQGFDREKEALKSAGEVEDLFLCPRHMGFPQTTYVKFGEQLREKHPKAANPEISSSVKEGFLPIDDVIVAWIDPYEISGRPLVAWVQDAMFEIGVEFKVWERPCREGRQALYGEILSVIYPSTASLHEIVNDANASQCIRCWADEILDRDLAYQFRRYVNYLREGTIEPLMARAVNREGQFEYS